MPYSVVIVSLLSKLKQSLKRTEKLQEDLSEKSRKAPELLEEKTQESVTNSEKENWKPFTEPMDNWYPNKFIPQKTAPPHWKEFRKTSSWNPESFTPEKYQRAKWKKFQADDQWEPQGCTRDKPYRPSPLPKGFFEPYKRPSKFSWDEIPDDVHRIHEVGSAERIYASQRPKYTNGYSVETPGAGVMRYRRQE